MDKKKVMSYSCTVMYISPNKETRTSFYNNQCEKQGLYCILLLYSKAGFEPPTIFTLSSKK